VKYEENQRTPLCLPESMPAGNVKSRKENVPESPCPSLSGQDHVEVVRKVRQPFMLISSGSHNKRQRIVTPASLKAIDKEDEPRSSPTRKTPQTGSGKEGKEQERRVLSGIVRNII
jgi:hypothetical protein